VVKAPVGTKSTVHRALPRGFPPSSIRGTLWKKRGDFREQSLKGNDRIDRCRAGLPVRALLLPGAAANGPTKKDG